MSCLYKYDMLSLRICLHRSFCSNPFKELDRGYGIAAVQGGKQIAQAGHDKWLEEHQEGDHQSLGEYPEDGKEGDSTMEGMSEPDGDGSRSGLKRGENQAQNQFLHVLSRLDSSLFHPLQQTRDGVDGNITLGRGMIPPTRNRPQSAPGRGEWGGRGARHHSSGGADRARREEPGSARASASGSAGSAAPTAGVEDLQPRGDGGGSGGCGGRDG
jgi:hypothetical protein